jgi:hypothetical protein
VRSYWFGTVISHRLDLWRRNAKSLICRFLLLSKHHIDGCACCVFGVHPRIWKMLVLVWNCLLPLAQFKNNSRVLGTEDLPSEGLYLGTWSRGRAAGKTTRGCVCRQISSPILILKGDKTLSIGRFHSCGPGLRK